MSGLEPFRRRLDELDEQIVALLAERFQTCREVAHFKSEHDVPMMQPDRVEQVRAGYLNRGAELDIPPDFMAAFFALLIDATCRMEDELIEATATATSTANNATPTAGGGTSTVTQEHEL